MSMSDLRIGLIGAGFIGRSHGLAIRAVNGVFADLPYRVVAHMLCDIDLNRAQNQARALGFAQATDDAKATIEQCDAVIIAVPSNRHAELVRHAVANGKPFLCEKPVGLSSQQAEDLAHAADRAGVPHAVGFTYLRAPMIAFARELIRSGRLGRILHFSGAAFRRLPVLPGHPVQLAA